MNDVLIALGMIPVCIAVAAVVHAWADSCVDRARAAAERPGTTEPTEGGHA